MKLKSSALGIRMAANVVLRNASFLDFHSAALLLLPTQSVIFSYHLSRVKMPAMFLNTIKSWLMSFEYKFIILINYVAEINRVTMTKRTDLRFVLGWRKKSLIVVDARKVIAKLLYEYVKLHLLIFFFSRRRNKRFVRGSFRWICFFIIIGSYTHTHTYAKIH